MKSKTVVAVFKKPSGNTLKTNDDPGQVKLDKLRNLRNFILKGGWRIKVKSEAELDQIAMNYFSGQKKM